MVWPSAGWRVVILPAGSGVSRLRPAWSPLPRCPPSALSPPGLALMMQLARELKTLARDLSVAVLVRKWAWPAMLAFSLLPGLHQLGRGSFSVLFISLKQQLLNPQSDPLGKGHSPTSVGHLECQTVKGSDT